MALYLQNIVWLPWFLTLLVTFIARANWGVKSRILADYRTRANKGRSILEAAPLRIQAKTYFLCVFYVITSRMEK